MRHNTFTFIFLFLLLLTAVMTSRADDFRELGSAGGSINAVDAAGETIFFGEGDQVVSARFDSKGHIQPLFRVSLGLPVHCLKTNGPLVLAGIFVSETRGYLAVIDARDPENLRLLARENIVSGVLDLAIDGSRAYVVSRYWLTVFDLADPAHPRQLYKQRFEELAAGIAVSGGRAYLSSTVRSNFYVLDVSQPTTITQIGFLAGVGGGNVHIQGNRAYVSNAIVDVSNPQSLKVLGRLPAGNFLAGPVVTSGSLVLLGTLEYSGYTQCTVRSVDVSNPAQPVLKGEYLVGDQVNSVCLAGGRLLATGDTKGLHVIDFTRPDQLSRQDWLPAMGQVSAMALRDRLAFVGDEISGLHVLDWTDPARPAILARYPVAGYVKDLALSSSTLVTAGESEGMRVIDVSDPSSPTLRARYMTGGGATGIATSGTMAFVTARQYGLEVVDFSDPARPVRAARLDLGDNCYDVALRGSLAYVISFSPGQLDVVDISNPRAPRWLRRVTLPYSSPMKISLQGDTALIAYGMNWYVTNGQSGVQFLSLANPQAPSLGAFIPTNATAKCALLGDNLLYAGCYSAYWGDTPLKVFGLAGGKNQAISSGSPAVADLAARDSFLLCAGMNEGLKVLQYENGAGIVSVTPPQIARSGFTTTLTLTLRNTGTSTWRAAQGYALRVLDDPREVIAAGAFGPSMSVDAQTTHTFQIPLTPDRNTSGTCPVKLQMGIDALGAFGPVVNVNVNAARLTQAEQWSLYR